jgi:hypothetical protein
MRRARLLAGLLVVTVAAGCSSGPARSLEKYCAQLQKDRGLLGRVLAQDQLKSTVSAMHRVDAAAPEQVRDQWHRVTLLVDEAATADLTNPATVSKLREQLVASQPAVNELVAFTKANCDLDLTDTQVTTAGTAVPSGDSTAPTATSPAGTLPPTVPPKK